MATEILPASAVRSPEAVLSHLRAAADHKASLRMYFSAAELVRGYRGPFAEETQTERKRLALEYETQGASAERDRTEHGPAIVSIPPPPAKPTWHCPACQTSFPEGLVICGKCGLDLRTGKPYQAVTAPAARPPRVPLSPTQSIHRPLGQRRHGQDYTAFWLILAVLAGMFILLTLLGLVKTKPPPEPPPPRKGTWQW